MNYLSASLATGLALVAVTLGPLAILFLSLCLLHSWNRDRGAARAAEAAEAAVDAVFDRLPALVHRRHEGAVLTVQFGARQ